MTNPNNAVAVRFHPLIDIDIDKATGRLKRIDVDLADSIPTEMYDYDADEELRYDDTTAPLYDAGAKIISTRVIPAIRDALTQVARDMGGVYRDGDRDEPLIVEHTFQVPIENIGGQNHGRDDWVREMAFQFGPHHGVDWTKEPLTFREVGSVIHVTARGTEPFLTFLCILFDLHADQHPGDTTDPTEAQHLEASIAAARAEAEREAQLAEVMALPDGPEKARRLYEMRGWLTVGHLREALAGEPDDRLVIFYDGAFRQHATIVEQDQEEPVTFVIGRGDSFDTREV